VLAAPVVAAIDSPRADVSAMDGYAARGEDLGNYPLSLTVVGESFPGSGWDGSLKPGTCIRIFTGAPLPQGANRIVIQERVRREGGQATIEADPGPATWVRPRGKDFTAGGEVLPAGRLLDPAALIAGAGADVAEVEVFTRPRVAVLSTGDELAEPGQARSSALAVPDSAALGVAALAEQRGAEVILRDRLRDALDQMRSAASATLAVADLVVVIGGASVGDRDFAKEMFDPLELLFSKISIRPGKPAWFGRAGSKLVLGLPGNPTSALVTARLLLAPLLTAMQGWTIDDALVWEPARLATPLPECDQRETFHRARLDRGEVSLVDFQESHAQRVLAQADVLVRQQPNSAPLPAGEIVSVLRL
jgi:molybdopterin molybdotransferase